MSYYIVNVIIQHLNDFINDFQGEPYYKEMLNMETSLILMISNNVGGPYFVRNVMKPNI